MRKNIAIILFCTIGSTLGLWLALSPILDEPLIFSVDRAANHFKQKDEGVLHRFSAWLVGSGLVSDWSKPPKDEKRGTNYPLLLSAASPSISYPYQHYTEEGMPVGLHPGYYRAPTSARMVRVSTTSDILQAISKAQAGDVISISPGNYTIRSRAISVSTAGTKAKPIYIRAQSFGTVTLHMDTLEGFHVLAPYWVFENLTIRGECAKHSYCEHAFHVVGKAHSFTLRNSELINFNAPIKVNFQPVGKKNYYPDRGLLEYNSFHNETPRTTSNPVTLLNINSADAWVVRGNFIADFSKNGSDRTSYGAFMKGNSSDGLFERNLVMCEHLIPADEGIRIGLSFGGGGSGKRICKHQSCKVEHSNGIMRNNIIMNCSRDVGIYLNRAKNIQIYHNLLYNNLGIDVRFETSSAQIYNNIISGRIKNRDSGNSSTSENIVARNCIGTTLDGCRLSEMYAAPEQADFRLTTLSNLVWKTQLPTDGLKNDFCGQSIIGKVNPGPLQYRNGMRCLQASIH